MTMPSEQEMRAAIKARNTSCDGQFYYGVVTTGVFCQPSCPARSAKPENLRFFPTIEDATAAGFRACKRCQPDTKSPRLNRLTEIARFIETHAEERITLEVLARIAGISASRLQRLFKQDFGVSPRQYQDAIRMQRFKQSLKEGNPVTDAIYSAGFGSVSRVYGEASRNIGMNPKAYRAGGAGESIYYASRHTALGLILMAATQSGVCFVQFGDNQQTLIDQLKQEFPNAQLSISDVQNGPELDDWINALDQHLSAGAPRPDLPIDMRGTAFQMKVWQFLLSVRDGDVLSYTELAQQIDKPRAVRAVASACAANRISVLIPCHRVLRSDGSLGGYRWGLARKRALLDAERDRRAVEVNNHG